jgi:hypothetical protein
VFQHLEVLVLRGLNMSVAHPGGIDFPVTLLPDGRHLMFQVTRGPETERGLYLFALPAAP